MNNAERVTVKAFYGDNTMSTIARNTLDAIPEDALITLVYHNGQAETTMKARELKEEMRGDPFDDRRDRWMQERVNTLA
jgi:hypothetical protein